MGTEENKLGRPGSTLPGLHDFEIPSKVTYDRFGEPKRAETKDEEIDRLSKSMHPENILKGMTQAGAMHSDPAYAQKVRTQIQKKLISMGTRLNELTPDSKHVGRNINSGIAYLNDYKNFKGVDEKTFQVLKTLHRNSSLVTEGSSSIDKENYRETTQGNFDLGKAVGIPAVLAAGFFGAPAMLPSFLARGAQSWAATTAMFGAGAQALKTGGDALGLKDQDLARAPEGFAEGMFMGNLIAPLTNPIMGLSPLRYLQKPIQAAFGLGSAWAASEGNYKTAGFLASGMGIGMNPKVPTRPINPGFDLRGIKLDWPARKPEPKKLPFDGLIKKIETGLTHFLGKPGQGKDTQPPTPAPAPPMGGEKGEHSYPSDVVPYPPNSKDFKTDGNSKKQATEEMLNYQKAIYSENIKAHPGLDIGNVRSTGTSSYATALENAYPGMPVEQMQALLNKAQINQNNTKKNPSEDMRIWDRFYRHMPNYRKITESQNLTVTDGSNKNAKVGGFSPGGSTGVFMTPAVNKVPHLLQHELFHGIQNTTSQEGEVSEGPASLQKNNPDNRPSQGTNYYTNPVEAGAHGAGLLSLFYRETGKTFEGNSKDMLKWANSLKKPPVQAKEFQNVIDTLKINHKKDPKSPSPESFENYLTEVLRNVVKADDNTQQPIYMNEGGKVPGADMGEDSVLTMLRPGENVDTVEEVKADEAAANAPPTPAPPVHKDKPEPVKQIVGTPPPRPTFENRVIRDPITGLWKAAPKEEEAKNKPTDWSKLHPPNWKGGVPDENTKWAPPPPVHKDKPEPVPAPQAPTPAPLAAPTGTGVKPPPTGFGRVISGGIRQIGTALRIPVNIMDAIGLADPIKDQKESDRQDAEIKAERERLLQEEKRIEDEKAKALKKKQDEEEAKKLAAKEKAAKEEKEKREEEERVRLAAVAAENARKKKEQEDTAAAVQAKEDAAKKDPPAPVAEPPVKVENPQKPQKENILKDIIPWLGLAAIQKEAMAFPTMISGIPTASAPSFEKTHLEILYYTEAGL